MRDRRRHLRGGRGFGRRLGLWCVMVTALGFALAANLWMHATAAPDTADLPLNALRAAYDRVVPGETAVPQLARIGFDTGSNGVKRLSYLSLMEYFAPGDSGGFDRLAPAAQQCLATPEGCSAYLFRLARAHGSESRASFGFVNAAEAQTPGVMQVVFLVHDGRVVYKAMSGV